MNHATTNTHLEVICGPMFAGKTTELMSRVAQAHAAGLRVLAVKPTRDTRYGHSELVTHTGLRIPALAVDRIADALEYVHDFVAIDEIHFFADEAVEHAWWLPVAISIISARYLRRLIHSSPWRAR